MLLTIKTSENICVGKHLRWSLFLMKLQAQRLATLLERDFNTIVFLWNLQNLLEYLFLKSSSGCFWGFNSCFQRNSEQKLVQLSAIYTGFNWKKSICCREKEGQHRCFPVNVAKFLRTLILKNICERLLLKISTSVD